MDIKHIRPSYKNQSIKQKNVDETLQRICGKIAMERAKNKRCN